MDMIKELEMLNERSDARKYEYDGKNLSLWNWSKVTGIPFATIRQRQARGWTVKDMVTVPLNQHRK
jgi:hypothetical protein